MSWFSANRGRAESFSCIAFPQLPWAQRNPYAKVANSAALILTLDLALCLALVSGTKANITQAETWKGPAHWALPSLVALWNPVNTMRKSQGQSTRDKSPCRAEKRPAKMLLPSGQQACQPLGLWVRLCSHQPNCPLIKNALEAQKRSAEPAHSRRSTQLTLL